MIDFIFCSEKKVFDLDKPIMTGAFVDPSKITQYTEEDYILPETPPFSWLMKNTKVNWFAGTTNERLSNRLLFTPQLEALNGDHTNEAEKTKSNKELSASPDVQHKNAMNNNNNTSNNNHNHNGTENTKPRTESVGDEKCLAKNEKHRFGSSKTLPPDDDRILKEMVTIFTMQPPDICQ